MMEFVKRIVQRKPRIFLIISVVYVLLVMLMNWRLTLEWDMVFFVVGGLLGVYFLDFAEEFFRVNPSPFRSIFFVVAYSIVSFFVVSSSASAFACGMVLSLYLQLLLWQGGELRVTGHMDSWYRLQSGAVSPVAQRTAFLSFCAVFTVLTIFFVRA